MWRYFFAISQDWITCLQEFLDIQNKLEVECLLVVAARVLKNTFGDVAGISLRGGDLGAVGQPGQLQALGESL